MTGTPLDPNWGEDPAEFARPESRLERSPWRIALVRAALLGVALALVVGPLEWALVGLVAIPLAFLERWGRRQRTPFAAAAQVLLLGWVLGAGGTLAALLQGVYVRGLVRARSFAQAWSDVWAAYRGLEDMALGNDLWAQLLPWQQLWTWARWGDAAVDTARAVGVVLAAPCVLRVLCARFEAGPGHVSAALLAVLQVQISVVLALFAFAFVLPPELPPGHGGSSLPGWTESLALLGMLAPMAAWTPIAYAIAERCGARPEVQPPRAGELRRRGGSPSVLAGGVLGGAAFVFAAEAVPSWVATSPVRRVLAEMAEGRSPETRAGAAHRLSMLFYAPDPEVLAGLRRALDDRAASVRSAAAGSVGRLRLSAARADLERVAATDPHSQVRRAAKDALELLDGGAR